MVLGQPCYVNYVKNENSKTSRSVGNRYPGSGQDSIWSSPAGRLKTSVTGLATSPHHPGGARGSGRPDTGLAATI